MVFGRVLEGLDILRRIGETKCVIWGVLERTGGGLLAGMCQGGRVGRALREAERGPAHRRCHVRGTRIYRRGMSGALSVCVPDLDCWVGVAKRLPETRLKQVLHISVQVPHCMVLCGCCAVCCVPAETRLVICLV